MTTPENAKPKFKLKRFTSVSTHDTSSTISTIHEKLCADVRYPAFEKVIRFINYELVDGAVLEFGVYTGRSLAALQIAEDRYRRDSMHTVSGPPRKFYGFDSFQGLYNSNHPRWTDGSFAKNHSWHPTIKIGETITPDAVKAFFKHINLLEPTIVAGLYDDTLPIFVNAAFGKAAIIHIDCDLYESTLAVLNNVEPMLQQGTILLFDDYYNYKGSPYKGEAAAFKAFQKSCAAHWNFVEYFQYGTFCKAFITVAVEDL